MQCECKMKSEDIKNKELLYYLFINIYDCASIFVVVVVVSHTHKKKQQKWDKSSYFSSNRERLCNVNDNNINKLKIK